MAQLITSSSLTQQHIALFPFMSKSHTIPLMHLTKLIHKHRPHATFTIFTTPTNEPFISTSLSSLPPNIVTIISLPFPTTNDFPRGVESIDQIPVFSTPLFYTFISTTEKLQPHFETALENLQRSNNPITFLISSALLHWTQPSASNSSIPRLSFSGFNMYCPTLTGVVAEHGFGSEHELFQVPDFPWIKVRKEDFKSFLSDGAEPPEVHIPMIDMAKKCHVADSMSCGIVVNSFYELEQRFVDYSNSKIPPKWWCVGPFCLAEKPTLESPVKPAWIEWLDNKSAQGKVVLYVAFGSGSHISISNEQLKEMAIGLEKSGVNFLWALRMKPNQEEVMVGYEERVKDRGLVVKGWVDQRVILEHESVQGFLSHCGWNSVIESVCAGVPILAWPFIADQPLNARMVVEEIEVGLRVETCDGLVKGFVKWEVLTKMVRELMEGEMGKVVREKVKVVAVVAKAAVEESGSSWFNLKTLLNELEGLQSSRHKNGNVNHETM